MTTEVQDHDHPWGEWTRWFWYPGDGRDHRERYCMGGTCAASDEEDREHAHALGRSYTDPMSPVAQPVLIRKCSTCGKTVKA
jgi:hypothetical protein